MKRTLTIRIDPDWQQSLRDNAVRAFSGKRLGELLTFATPELFFGRLTSKRWELIRLLQRHGPAGVRETARLAERDVRRVHDDIQALLEIGLIEKQADGKIVCPYDDIHVDMHVRAA